MILRETAICPACGLDHNSKECKHNERKTWPRNLETFLSHVDQVSMPEGVTGPAPTSVGWTHYNTTWDKRGVIHRDTFKGFVSRQIDLSRVLGKKGEGHLFTNPVYPKAGGTKHKDGGIVSGPRKDSTCASIEHVSFDSDTSKGKHPVGWERLRGFFARAGVEAFFTESSSRKFGNFHLTIPLAKPLTFANEEERREFKHQYRHVASVFSAYAGHKSVGGKCGKDLTTDGLAHPFYYAFMLTPDDRDAQCEYLPGAQALDWHAFLKATGYDAERAKSAAKVRTERSQRARSLTKAVFSGDFSQLGPMGQALNVAGVLTNQPKTDGLIAHCPFNASHAGDAKYLPASDIWLCAHHSCKQFSNRRGQKHVLAALGSEAQLVYEKVSKQRRQTWWQVEQRRNQPPIHVGAWLREMKGKAEEWRLFNAVAGALLRRHFSDGFVVRAFSEVEDQFTAERRVGETLDRLKRKVAVAGAGWIRRTLGVHAALALADAVARDTGQPFSDMARYFLGMNLARGGEGEFLKAIHDKLQSGDKVKTMVWRPAGCRKFGDDVKDWGKKAGRIVKVCETLGCGHCFFVRLMIEADMLASGWEQGGEKIEGWEGRKGPFWLHRVTGLRDSKHLDELLLWVSRYCRQPKVRILDWDEGQHAVTFVTNEFTAAADVRSLKHWFGLGEATYTEVKTDKGGDAAQAALAAKIRLHTRWRELVDERKEDELVAWIRWVKGRHLVSRSRAALPWPTREAVKAASVAKNKEEWEFDPDYKGGGVTYTAVHIDTGFELDTSKNPHTLYKMMCMAGRRPRLQEIAEPPGADYFEAHAAACARTDTIHVLAVPV